MSPAVGAALERPSRQIGRSNGQILGGGPVAASVLAVALGALALHVRACPRATASGVAGGAAGMRQHPGRLAVGQSAATELFTNAITARTSSSLR